MKDLKSFSNSHVRFLLTDIDDTITDDGELSDKAYGALWDLARAGISVIPVTGRPAGWCDLIARFWPVAGVVGENGAFYFRYLKDQKKMKRVFSYGESELADQQKKLKLIESEVLKTVPGARVSADQFSRLTDLAIDFCEDVPALPKSEIQKIKDIFESHGATAKISSIHVNGWFGQYNKVTTALKFLKDEFALSEGQAKKVCAFSGDSPNDEPMFEFFPLSFAVANIKNFAAELRHEPSYVATQNGGRGFCEIARALLRT